MAMNNETVQRLFDCSLWVVEDGEVRLDAHHRAAADLRSGTPQTLAHGVSFNVPLGAVEFSQLRLQTGARLTREDVSNDEAAISNESSDSDQACAASVGSAISARQRPASTTRQESVVTISFADAAELRSATRQAGVFDLAAVERYPVEGSDDSSDSNGRLPPADTGSSTTPRRKRKIDALLDGYSNCQSKRSNTSEAGTCSDGGNDDDNRTNAVDATSDLMETFLNLMNVYLRKHDKTVQLRLINSMHKAALDCEKEFASGRFR